jgi:hypothetical protein
MRWVIRTDAITVAGTPPGIHIPSFHGSARSRRLFLAGLLMMLPSRYGWSDGRRECGN